MTKDSLARRCAMLLLAAMLLALCVGLLAWGPVALAADVLGQAELPRGNALPWAWTAMATVSQAFAGWWGWQVTRRSGCAVAVRRPWCGFHLCLLLAALAGLYFHLVPSSFSWAALHAALCGASALLVAGALAERIDRRFGSARAVALSAVGVLVAGVAVAVQQGADIRLVLIFEMLPLLLLPAGVPSVQGAYTRASDWIVISGAYALGIGAAVVAHAAMHPMLAAVAVWLGYCTLRANAEGADGAGSSQRQTSLNTSG